MRVGDGNFFERNKQVDTYLGPKSRHCGAICDAEWRAAKTK